MKIRELFEKPIDRFIEGVIKADDDRNLIDEMDEYIITKDISKNFDRFLKIILIIQKSMVCGFQVLVQENHIY